MKALRFRYLVCLLVSFVLTANALSQTKAIDKPNIIIFLVDDLGWTDLGCFGSEYYKTPAIDKMADEGVKFTNAYSSCNVCSPTRAALMTGKNPARLHVTDWITGHKFPFQKMKVPDWTMYLSLDETTLPEVLKKEGYFTVHIGKWHLGEDSIYWPEHHGFDVNIGGYSVGRPVKGYFSPYGNPRLKDGTKGEYLTERLTEEAIKIIKNNKNQPLYLNMSYYSVHTKLMAPELDIEKCKKELVPGYKHNNPVYAAMISQVDRSIMKIMQALKEQGQLDNTFVLFMSDNGGLGKVTSNEPLRKGKGTIYEGGIRVPMIAWAPWLFKGKRVSKTPVITTDAFATIVDLVKGNLPKNVDGVSLLPLLIKKKKLKRKSLYWHYPHYHNQGAVPHSVIRKGNWKLIHVLDNNSFELYNLKKDISEQNNLVQKNPEKMKYLKAELKKWQIDVDAQMPIKNPNFDQEYKWKKKKKKK